MAAFSRRGGDCWVQELQDTILQGTPVIVLQYYGPEPSTANGTHFRVAIGADIEAGTVTLLGKLSKRLKK